MPLVPSLRYMNWSSTTFATVPIDGIKNISVDHGVTDLQEGADMDLGPTIAIVTGQNPSFTIETIHAAVVVAQVGVTRGVFTTTLNDSRNQALTGGGGKVFTTNNLSYIGANTTGGAYQQLATDAITIKTQWVDGVTNPVSVSAA